MSLPERPTANEPEVPAVAVILHELTKLYGRFAALRGVTAEFAAARLFVIVGDNGAGKSTLLRALAGLLEPTRGTLAVLGSAKVRDVAAQIGYMAHAPLLYDELDALENLRYAARLYGIPGDARCQEIIRAVGLDPALKRRVGQYSQGMRQRLSLARALVHDPSLLLLDEPFSNVDAASAHVMVHLLGSLRERGRTLFVVTHQPALLEGVADEQVQMAAGLITERRAMAHAQAANPRSTRAGAGGQA